MVASTVMSNLKRMVLLLVGASLGSCATEIQRADPAIPAGHHFSYKLADNEQIHLIQAFDDGSNTYLQFDETPATALVVRIASGENISFIIEPHYLVVQGIHDVLHVSVAESVATVINQTAPRGSLSDTVTKRANSDERQPSNDSRRAPMSTATALETVVLPESVRRQAAANDLQARRVQVAPIGVPESLQTMDASLRVPTLKHDISTLEDHIGRLTTEIEEAHRAESGGSIYMRSVAGSPRIVLKFDDHSVETRIEDELLETIGDAARAANRIYLHGHTDAFVASETGTELAIRRAVAVRQLLISLKVEPERIRLFYRGAGNFVANNSTPEGKALNRRVEIELRKW